MQDSLLTVARGEKLNDELIEKRIRDLLHKDKALTALLQKLKSSKGDYSGTFYSNCFRVDQPIRLVDIGFFGPCELEAGRFVVHLEIFEPGPKSGKVYPSRTNGMKIARTREIVSVKRGTNFFIEPCNGGIQIRPGVWYLIQFMLEGPSTYKCETTVRAAQVIAPGGKEINFEFDVGSMQMPFIRFTI